MKGNLGMPHYHVMTKKANRPVTLSGTVVINWIQWLHQWPSLVLLLHIYISSLKQTHRLYSLTKKYKNTKNIYKFWIYSVLYHFMKCK